MASLVRVTTTVTGVFDSPGVVPDAVTTEVTTIITGGTDDSEIVDVDIGDLAYCTDAAVLHSTMLQRQSRMPRQQWYVLTVHGMVGDRSVQ